MTIEFEEIREPQRLYPEDIEMYDGVLERVMTLLLDRERDVDADEVLRLTRALHRLRVTLKEKRDVLTL